jgi:putative membrane protein
MSSRHLLLAALTLSAQLHAQPPHEKTSPLAPDSDFVQVATGNQLGTVQLSDIAVQRASTDMVKTFAKRMVADYRRVNDDLNTAAKEEGLKVATSMNAESKATFDVLSGLPETQLDQTYIRIMIRQLNGDVVVFQKEADAGKNPKIRAFASSRLSSLKDNLKLARDAASQMGLTVETTGP